MVGRWEAGAGHVSPCSPPSPATKPWEGVLVPAPGTTAAHSSPSGSPARSLPNETCPVTPCHPGSGLSRMLLCESSLLPWVTVSTRRGSTCTHKPDPGPSRLSMKGRDRSSAKRGSPGVWGSTPPTPQADPAHVAYNTWLLHPWGVPPPCAGHACWSQRVFTRCSHRSHEPEVGVLATGVQGGNDRRARELFFFFFSLLWTQHGGEGFGSDRFYSWTGERRWRNPPRTRQGPSAVGTQEATPPSRTPQPGWLPTRVSPAPSFESMTREQ